MMNHQEFLKEGDRLTGKPCVVPASLSHCDGCGCLRRADEGWFVKRTGGYPYHFCSRHDKETAIPN